MPAFHLLIRTLVTASALLTLLGPTIADAEHDDLPVPPEAEPSEPDERDTRPRPNRREQRDASHLDARDVDPVGADSHRPTLEPAITPSVEPDGDGTTIGTREVEARADGARSTQIWFASRGAAADGRADLLARRTAPTWQDWPPTWPDEFTTGASCEVSCIKWGKAHDNGNHMSVHLNVKTTTPVLWQLKVINDELGYSVTKAEHHAWTTQATTTYTDLEAGTTYEATVVLRDAWGNVEEASGSFTTSY